MSLEVNTFLKICINSKVQVWKIKKKSWELFLPFSYFLIDPVIPPCPKKARAIEKFLLHFLDCYKIYAFLNWQNAMLTPENYIEHAHNEKKN